jgi:hypothetical protein
VLEQRIGRIYRLGQKKPIDVYNLVSEQGIESRISVLVDSKQAFFKGLFDGETDTIRFGEASGFLSRIQKLIDPSAIAVVSARGGQAEAEPDRGDTDSDIDINDEVSDPIDELIEAADEAADSPPTPAPLADGDGRGETGGSGSLTAPAAAAQAAPTPPPEPRPEPAETAQAPRPGTNGTPRPATTVGIRDLFAQLQVRREPTGKVVIEAPDEVAGELGALFEGMAALLQSIRQ